MHHFPSVTILATWVFCHTVYALAAKRNDFFPKKKAILKVTIQHYGNFALTSLRFDDLVVLNPNFPWFVSFPIFFFRLKIWPNMQ